jgi:hypothetical protein
MWYLYFNLAAGILVPWILILYVYLKSTSDKKHYIDKALDWINDQLNNQTVFIPIIVLTIPIGLLMMVSSFIWFHSVAHYLMFDAKKLLTKKSIIKLVELGYKEGFSHRISNGDLSEAFLSTSVILTNYTTDFENDHGRFNTISCKKAKEWLYNHYGVEITTKFRKKMVDYRCRYLGSNHVITGEASCIAEAYEKIILKVV